jgi:cytochrome c-type biogenesis protein CcmH
MNGVRLRRVPAFLPALIVIVALAAGIATVVVVATGRHAPSSRAAQVQEIAAGLHCPICKDLSVADSPAPLAQQMREEIAQKLSTGESADQIRASFVAAYGDSVLMSPPRHGLAGAAYYLPLLVLGSGLVIALALLRRWLRTPEPDPPGDESPPAPDGPLSASQRRALDKAVARLREEEPA